MKNSIRILCIPAALGLLLMGGGLLNASPTFLKSPQKEATAGQFYSDADSFIDPRLYTKLEFDQWFGLISFQGNHADFGVNAMAQIGAAARFGGLYTGLYYGGNAWRIQPHTYSETEDRAFFGSPKTIRSYASLPITGNTYKPRNEVAFLAGIADMGFRLSYVSTHQFRNLTNDFRIDAGGTPAYYRNFRDEYGSINPEIAWGMTKELVPGKGIKPKIEVDLDFFRDYQKYDKYNTAADSTGDTIGRSNNRFTLGLTAALGGFSLLDQNNFDVGFDLQYVLGLTAYNNEYNYTDGGKNKIAKYKGKYDSSANSFKEEGENSHAITPSLYASWTGDAIALSAEVGLGLGFGGEKTSELDNTTGSTLVKDGADQNTAWFGFAPTLDVGMKWGIVPDKFFLNAGGHVEFGSVGWETAKTTFYSQGKEDGTKPAEKEISSNFTPAKTSLSIGAVFFPTANLGLQAMCGVDSGTNNISLFDTAAKGLAVFSKVLVTVKF